LFFIQAIGAAIGPVIVGGIFDATGGYRVGYAVAATIFFAAAVAVLGCMETYLPAPAAVAVAGD
jgi:cyanate permease